jgi:hypothetical protein
VPKDQIVGDVNRGWDVAKYLLGHEREMISGGGLGTDMMSIGAQYKDVASKEPVLRADMADFDACARHETKTAQRGEREQHEHRDERCAWVQRRRRFFDHVETLSLARPMSFQIVRVPPTPLLARSACLKLASACHTRDTTQEPVLGDRALFPRVRARRAQLLSPRGGFMTSLVDVLTDTSKKADVVKAQGEVAAEAMRK